MILMVLNKWKNRVVRSQRTNSGNTTANSLVFHVYHWTQVDDCGNIFIESSRLWNLWKLLEWSHTKVTKLLCSARSKETGMAPAACWIQQLTCVRTYRQKHLSAHFWGNTFLPIQLFLSRIIFVLFSSAVGLLWGVSFSIRRENFWSQLTSIGLQ